MPVKVSVVVPVFNPGEHIATSVDSLLAQTMPADELELIFVDDGSTDATPARLDRLAEEHPQLKVIHEPPSGWSGRPRNVGLEAAVGDYVLFVDQDDRLGDEALTRMHAMAVRNRSDIVIGKMVGVARGVPVQLFRKSWDDATIHDSPIIDSLTPHKMFRRAFLLESGLRFPEGPRRLEDHVFVVAAYFAASRISVLSDYACYYHISRGDHGNAGYRPLEPRSYLANLAEALDIVDAHTEPGPARDRLHRRWMRVEILGRLRGAKLLRAAEGFREDFVREARTLVEDRFAAGVDAGLSPMERLAARLLRAGNLAALLQLAQWESRLTVQARLGRAHWREGTLELEVSADLVDGGDVPVALREINGARMLVLPLPPEVLEGVPLDTLAVGDAAVVVELFARHSETKAQQFLTGADTVHDSTGLGATVTARLPLSAGSAGSQPPVDGGWQIFARWRAFGWNLSAPVITHAPTHGAVDPLSEPALIGDVPRLATPRRSSHGQLRVELTALPLAQPAAVPPTIQLGRRRPTISARHRVLTMDLPLRLATDRSWNVAVQATPVGAGAEQSWPAVLEPDPVGTRGAASILTAAVDDPRLAPGEWDLLVSPAGVGPGLPVACRLLVRGNGSVRLRRHPLPSRKSQVLSLLPAPVADVLRTLRQRVG